MAVSVMSVFFMTVDVGVSMKWDDVGGVTSISQVSHVDWKYTLEPPHT